MKGILVNYEFCTGCHSCEVACRNELGLKRGEYGIKVSEIGPWKYSVPVKSDTPFEWVYMPVLTRACNMCEDRVAMGKLPSCEQACQAWCIYHGEIEDLVKKMDGDSRWVLLTTKTAK